MVPNGLEHPIVPTRPPPAHAAGASLLPMHQQQMEIPPRRVTFDLTRNETLPNGYGTDPDYLEDKRNRMAFWHLLRERWTCSRGNNVSGMVACNDAISQVWEPSSSSTAGSSSAPPAQPGSKPVLVLDMDETMIYGEFSKELAKLMRDRTDPSQLKHFKSKDLPDYWVLKRPDLLPFLREVRKHYRLFVWTAGLQSYADPILDWIEEDDNFFERRYFRHSCTQSGGQYVKDLRNLAGVEISRVLLLDNSKDACLFNQANGVPIIDFKGNMEDRELLGTYTKVLRLASRHDDVRKGIESEFKDCVAKKCRLVSTLENILVLLFEYETNVTYLSFNYTPYQYRFRVIYKGQ
jgi:Dullard-like phosphatase family protein